MSEFLLRVSIDIAFVCVAAVAPWWLVLVLGALVVATFPFYGEILGIALVLDAVFVLTPGTLPIPWMTISVFAMLVISVFGRRMLRISEPVDTRIH